MTSAPTASHRDRHRHDDRHDDRDFDRSDRRDHPDRRAGHRPAPGSARRLGPVARSAALAAGAVLLLGAGLTACKGGASLCLSDDSCDVVVRTDNADSTHTVEVFGGDRTVRLTVGRITDTTAEVRLGEETRTLTEDTETAVGTAKITLRHADARGHTAELHVVR
ncbi:hypothetical protein [Kitasatospora sp. NPDC002965]|uniref:hypothetical protein n=1 Tax=Kitasatospora sp. NPDC002965 TaxID=3154775 RepID=UPI0033A46150